MSQAAHSSNAELQNAFEVFNDVSRQLANSYQELEGRVASLNQELVTAQNERLRELTEKVRVADRLQSLLKALPAGVIVLDAEGVVVECNPAAEGLLGEPLAGMSWLEVIKRAFAPQVDDGHDISLRDGRRVSISTQALGNEPGQILLLQDVTETRKLQEGLSRHKRLSDMGEMAAQLAHQIRTPLASALLYCSHLEHPGIESDKRLRVAGKIRNSLHQLEGQVNDMLMFAKGGSCGGEQIHVNEFLKQIHESMEAQLQQCQARLDVQTTAGNTILTGNREALRGAIQNLINNAMQACGEQAQLRLVASLRKQNGVQAVVISLTDNGPGIPRSLQEQIFEPFYTTRSRGTGLGLAVVKAVAHAHNGTMWVESEAGRGSTFSLFLPLNVKNSALSSGQSGNNTVRAAAMSEER
ncbi:sensor histidine kinase [Sulfuriflexus sp.]|uniref:sensor histidine kinase n=1 Tax=Sulfuriflexus sp. TaxID=2015443 RepID=UPI0028CF3756|nr:ATP-binding protein [Sulfuriflexus sp.]MDT8403933.1 ATP-binding protein [Sulfuriflexus sp.]